MSKPIDVMPPPPQAGGGGEGEDCLLDSANRPPLESMVRTQQLIGTLHSLTQSLDQLTAGVGKTRCQGTASITSMTADLGVNGERPSLVASLPAQEREGFLAKLRQGQVTEAEMLRYSSAVVEAREAEPLYPSALAVPPTRVELEQTLGRFRSNRDLIDEVAGTGQQALRPYVSNSFSAAGEVSALLSTTTESEEQSMSSAAAASQRGAHVYAVRESVSVTRVVRDYEAKLLATAKAARSQGFDAGFVDGERTAAEKVSALQAEVCFLKDKLRVHETLARNCFKQKEATDGKMAFARDQRSLAESKLVRLSDVEQLKNENAALRYERDVFFAAAMKAHAPRTAELERMLTGLHRQVMELFDRPATT